MGAGIFIKITYLLLMFSCCGFALWRGGRPERISAAIILIASFATPLVENAVPYASPEYGILLVDSLALAGLLAVALSSNRYWPLFATAFHFLATIIHVLTIIDAQILPQAYANLQAFWAWPMLLALAFGTWREVSRIARRR